MKKFYILKRTVLVLFSIFISAQLWADDYPKLKADFEKVKLGIGETKLLPQQLRYFENETSEAVEVTVTWTVDPESLGTIDATLLFTAENEGEGYLLATYETLSHKIELEVEKDDDGKENGDDNEEDGPKVKIIPGNLRVELGETLELFAFYIDELGNKAEATFVWSVEPSELGTITDGEEPVFQADNTGEGRLIATFGELADTVKIKVYESKWKDKKDKSNNSTKIEITPGDLIVHNDAPAIQYAAEYLKPGNSGNKDDPEEVTWTVSDSDIASIDENGLLTLSGETGLTLVTAMISKRKASVELLVLDPSVDPEVNTIAIHRVLPDGKELKPRIFKEGESYKIVGLPYPLNVLNAGRLHFPFGCIEEDITIYMKIPEEYADLNDDYSEVEFTEEIITGIQFSVKPAGSEEIVEPFYFNIPVELSLVFKHGILDSLGVLPEDLDVFFAENVGFVKDGTDNVVVDTVKNKIYASIEHFSTIVVREKSALTSANSPLAQEESLTVFPNPFTISTTLQFKLEEKSTIDIAVYNLHGQLVKQLATGEYPTGAHKISWQGEDENGKPASNGVYFCTFGKNGNFVQTQKIILNR